MGMAPHQDVAVSDELLGHDADVDGVAVPLDARASGALPCDGTHPLTAEGPWDEAVRSGAQAGELLRAIHLEMTGGLVNFILYRVVGHDLEVNVEDAFLFPENRCYAVPRVGLEVELHKLLKLIGWLHRSLLWSGFTFVRRWMRKALCFATYSSQSLHQNTNRNGTRRVPFRREGSGCLS